MLPRDLCDLSVFEIDRPTIKMRNGLGSQFEGSIFVVVGGPRLTRPNETGATQSYITNHCQRVCDRNLS